jgi:hypothetical protein
MTTLTARRQGLAFAAPNYQAVTAADKFLGASGAKYLLHYKNGATAQASSSAPNKVTDPSTPIPSGSAAVAGFADLLTSAGTGMGATSEATIEIDNATRFIDGTGFINLVHPGTLTTVTVDIIGPL